jgi:hypothetical protein
MPAMLLGSGGDAEAPGAVTAATTKPTSKNLRMCITSLLSLTEVIFPASLI